MLRIATRLVIGLALLLGAGSASAGKPDHAGKKGKGPPAEKGAKSQDHAHDSDGVDVVVFTSSQRSSFESWYHDQYGSNCPPGLAKKHNGCMPPGQAKKRYALGAPLPPGIVLGPLPSALAILLGTAPAGYRYGILDGDVVKLAIGTALVVDAIEGLASR